MSVSAHANIIARPLRFGFLLRRGSLADLRQAVVSANAQWGGRWSVMVPMLGRRSSRWSRGGWSPSTAAEVTKNIVDRFDPDFLVQPDDLDLGRTYYGRRVLAHSDLRRQNGGGPAPRYGIGWLEVLRTLYEQEFQYKKVVPLRVVLPTLPRTNRVFWEMTFGQIPDSGVTEEVARISDAKRTRVGFDNLHDVLHDDGLLPGDLLGHDVEVSRWNSPRGPFAYLHDHSSWLDLLDFWNMRALGARVVPVPTRCLVDGLSVLASRISSRAREGRDGITLLKSRTITDAVVDEALDVLKRSSEEPRGAVASVQRIPIGYWGPWKSQRESSTAPQLSAGRVWADLSVNRDSSGRERVVVPLLAPEVGDLEDSARRVAFANDVTIHLYGADQTVGQVVPSGDERFTHQVYRVVGGGGRASHGPLVLYGSGFDDKSVCDVPPAHRVLSVWLGTHGVSAEPSTPGRHASAMLSRLGPHGMRLLGSDALIDLLRRHAGIPKPILERRLYQIARRATGDRPNPGAWTKQLTDRGILALGLQVKCPTCGRKPWYGLADIAPILVCGFCHGRFATVQHKPPGDWAYRLVGPFDVRDESLASACVLLTMRLVGELVGPHSENRLTAYPGLDAQIGEQNFEIDLVGLMKHSSERECATPVFAEAKSGARLQKKDIQRMEFLASKFPGALIVFATLADGFDEAAVGQLKRLVARLERRQRRDPGARVLILARAELLYDDAVGSAFFRDHYLDRARDVLRWQARWRDLCLESQRLHLGRDLRGLGVWNRTTGPLT